MNDVKSWREIVAGELRLGLRRVEFKFRRPEGRSGC